MKKILLIILLSCGSVQSEYDIEKQLMQIGCMSMAGVFIVLARNQWRSERGSKLESCFLVGCAVGCVGQTLYMQKNS